jgi:hypothetical protein
MRRTYFATAILGLALASQATAQRLSLSPQIGFYIPTENLYQIATTGGSGDDFQLEAGPSFGARLGLWFGSRFGIEVGGMYVPTTFQFVSTAGTNPLKQDAKLFIGSGQAVLYLLPRTGILSLFLEGGVGVVSRGGIAFTSEAKTSDIGGIVGAGAGIRLGGIMLTAGADLLSYKAEYRGSQLTSQELRQKDIALKFGLGFGFGPR